MNRHIVVTVQDDHVHELAKARNPVNAIAELIWNALDADANAVSVKLKRNMLGGIESIVIADNGHGIPFQKVDELFGSLGGSWKGTASRSLSEKRLLHGRFGKGRFRAFALGPEVTWSTRVSDNGSVKEYTIFGSSDDLTSFEVEDLSESSRSYAGTEVKITGITKSLDKLLSEDAFHELIGIFSIYLGQYPEVMIEYDGEELDPGLVRSEFLSYGKHDIELDDGSTIEMAMDVCEWRTEMGKWIYLCDSDGFAIDKVSARIQAPGYSFTTFIRSDVIREVFDESGTLAAAEMDLAIGAMLQVARDRLRARYRELSAGAAAEQVERWKEEKTYPYTGEPVGPVELVERQVFDVLALAVSDYLPDFESTSTETRRFQFRLLRQALEESPKALKQILEELLLLPTEKLEKLAELLETTTLTAIINASAEVAQRLDFLTSLKALLFDYKKHLKERSQLQKLLEPNTWLFGEEFALMISDQDLTNVLRKHISILDREELHAEVEPVVRDDGSTGIVDLMLSRSMKSGSDNQHEHLIIELKRPSKKIDQSVLNQIQSYAFAVAKDERFKDTNTKWIFWAVSNEMDGVVQELVRQKNKPPGQYFESNEMPLTIWVKSWGEVLRDAQDRMQFFKDGLEYSPDDESALERLRAIHKNLGLPSSEDKAQ